MKKILLIAISFIFLVSCAKNDKTVKIIKPVKGEYTFRDFWVVFEKGQNDLIDSLSTDIKNFLKKINLRAQKSLLFDYELYINPEGKLDKILVLQSLYPEVDEYVAEHAAKWEFKKSMGNQPAPTRTNLKLQFFIHGNEITGSIEKGNRFVMFTKKESTDTYFIAVEEMPEPIGGIKAIQEKIVYPELAQKSGIEGRVFVKAYIDETGNVVDAEIIKGIGGGCDEAAIKAVKATKFNPGKQRGKPVKVQVSVPILFRLNPNGNSK